MKVEHTFHEKFTVHIKKHFDENVNDEIIYSTKEFFRINYF